ncbi:hypothetical protein C2S53_009830 [Perilla frutescens var. hirtella]|uniref:Uncharacterized protein n=1 Tax=Perilla frutescens var. hirtella TaxID=608512 RepID=A0AAD4JHE3_PERFH|nr:hypothetical protein C2S53_009830 [Perilla frutescens var. hirtella]
MKSLGIADLSNQLKRRRSSRLKELPPVSFSERKKSPKKDHSSNSTVEIHIPEGENPEIYTDEHEMLLGDSIAAWTLYVDGFDEDGQRMHDPLLGRSCHQCRSSTALR